MKEANMLQSSAEKRYIDPVEWSELLDEVSAELADKNGEELADRLAELKATFINVFRLVMCEHFEATEEPYNVDVFCRAQTLALVEKYFSAEDIAELCDAGFLFILRTTRTQLHRYPKLQHYAAAVDHRLLEDLKNQIGTIANVNSKRAALTKKLHYAKSLDPYSEDVRKIEEELNQLPACISVLAMKNKIIKFIFEKIQAGMDINALGQNGRGLVHELMYLNIPDEIFGDIAQWLTENPYFDVEWLLHDSVFHTVLHHAKVAEKSEAVIEELRESGRCVIAVCDSQLNSVKFGERLVNTHYVVKADFTSMEMQDLRPGQIRGWLSALFTAIERALPHVDVVEEFDLSSWISVEKFLNRGNWDLLMHYPGIRNEFFLRAEKILKESTDLEEEEPSPLLTFVVRLSEECLERNVDADKNLKAIRDGVFLFLQKHIRELMQHPPRDGKENAGWFGKEFILSWVENLPSELNIKLLGIKDEAGNSFLSYLCLNWECFLPPFVVYAPSVELIEYLITQGVEVKKIENYYNTFLHRLCSAGEYDSVICLVKHGFNVWENDLSACGFPIETLENDLHPNSSVLRKFLEYRMGITLKNIKIFERSTRLNEVMTLQQFAALEEARQDALLAKEYNPIQRYGNFSGLGGHDSSVLTLENKYGIRLEHLLRWPVELVSTLLIYQSVLRNVIDDFLREGQTVSFFDLYNLDPRADKPLLIKWFKCSDTARFPLSNAIELQQFKKWAHEVALYRTSVDTQQTFFARAPRDLACRVVAAARPKCLSYSDAILFADKMLPKTKKTPAQDVRQTLIQELAETIQTLTEKGLFASPVKLLQAAGFRVLHKALQNPTQENIAEVDASREEINAVCRESHLKTLVSKCLAMVKADKEKLCGPAEESRDESRKLTG